MARHNTESSAARANHATGAARRARALRPFSPRVRLLCLVLCYACALLPSSPMLASGPRADRPSVAKSPAAPAPARQTQESPAGLPDLNEARNRPRHEPRAVPPVPSTLRRCPPRSRRRCGGPSSQSPDATPTPSPAATPSPSATPAPSPSASRGHAALSGPSGPTVAAVASYSLLALASAAMNGGRPVLDLPLIDFYAPGGGYAETDAPALPLAAQSALNPPSGLQVTATSDTQVSLSWSPPAGVTNYRYRIERATSLSGPYSAANAAAVTNAGYGDSGVSRAVSYLYRVCAADSGNNCVSPYSNVVMATAYTFADDPIVTYADYLNNHSLVPTPIRLTHVTQLREAVNSVRHLAGRADATWTHPTLIQYQSVVSAADVQDLRDRLGEALADLGVPVAAYINPTLSTGQNGTVVMRDHIKQLRDRARSGAVGGDGVPSGQGTGLTGQYYGDTGLSVYKLTRTDATVNFGWGTGSPDPSIANDNFSVRWAGMVVPLYTETYTLYTTTDEGLRLWVDGQLLIDHWADQTATQWSGQVSMQAGRAYAVRMEYYEHQGAASAKLEWSSPSQAREVVPQSQLYPCWKDAGQYVADYFQGVLGRQPNTTERQEWVSLLDQAEGGDQLVAAAQGLGKTLFNSTEYAARNPDHGQTADATQYVSDLYHGYMQRDPDQLGWNYWTQNTLSNGRAATLAAFAAGAEFQEKVRRLCGTAAAATNNGGVGYDFSTARLDPSNRTGGGGADPLSRNFSWSVPLVSLPGRSGLDLGLTLSYNSLVWTKDSTGVTFDADDGFPGPGFRLGFPTVEPRFLNPQTGQYTYMMITPSGARVELRQVGTSSNYESADSSYMQLTDGGGALTLTTADGTRLYFMLLDGEYFCYQVEDRNGNFISVAYYGDGRIQQVTDTLGRTITFNYDANQNLTSITQAWKRETEAGAADETHTWATFGYRSPNLTLLPLFTNLAVIGDQPGETIPVLSQVGLDDGSYYTFDYNDWGQVWKVTHYAADAVNAQGQPNYSHALSYTKVNLPGSDLAGETAQTDCPRFTEEHTWVEYGVRNQSAEVVTSYQPAWSPAMAECDITPPTDIDSTDGLVVKEFYATTGWQKGLVTSEQFSVGGTNRKWTGYTWDHDGGAGALYPTNPRVTNATVTDSEGNSRGAATSYFALTLPDGSTCNLPKEVSEYATDPAHPLRTTGTDYNVPNLSQYLSRHIVGLPNYSYVYEGASSGGTLRSKAEYLYDDTGHVNNDANLPPYLQALPQGATATQHDIGNYPATFTWRGNVTRVRRDEVDPASGALTGNYTESQASYYVTGAAALSRDAAGHVASVSYADSFYGNVNRSNPSLPTYAYPTTVTDPDGFTATTVYNYDMGAATQRQTPLPNVQTNQPGPVSKTYYDAAGRVIKSLAVDNGAYTRLVYQPSMELVQAYALIDAGVETYSGSVLDGAGRVRAKAATHPNSAGGYAGQIINYDAVGRVASQSNPTETDTAGGTWAATGDDSTANGGYGWLYTQSTYDWKGRPFQVTNTDNTTEEFLYGGCGCAGGEVVTTRDEVGRRQKVTYDVLGRVWKTQVLTQQDKSQQFSAGTDADVYSTVTNMYDALDRVTQVTEQAGVSGTSQVTTTGYDGYGRLQTRHTPDQDAGKNTSYTYNADDTVNTVTDGRGAVTTYGYTGNNRGLVTSVSNALSGLNTVSVGYAYDAARNRIRMDDAQGWQTYTYDSLSKLSSETRYFNNLGRSYTLSYSSYNLAGQPKVMSDPFGAQITYQRDAAGRLTDVKDVTATPYAGVSTYVSNARYRAWGAVKSASFGDNTSETISYDGRMRPYHYLGAQREDFAYYADGRLQTLTDLDDGPGSQPPSTYHFFSRSYTYDHEGRVLHGGGVSSNSPFQQDYAYDEFDNMTSRSGSEGWNPSQTDSPIHYTNGRRDGWTYDQDGRLTLSPANSASNQRTWSYDAAGRLVSTTETSGSSSVTLSDDYDGDGQSVREAQVGGSNPATYYLVRSSVLGGDVVTRLTAAGAKAYTYVPAGGLVNARQTVLSSNNQQAMEWTHRDPVGVSEPGAAYDPLGNYVSPVNPQQPGQPPPTMGTYGPGYGGAGSTFGNANNYSTGCTLDGAAVDCNSVMRAVNSGTARISSISSPGLIDLGGLGLIPALSRQQPQQPNTPPHLQPTAPTNPSPGDRNPYNIQGEDIWSLSFEPLGPIGEIASNGPLFVPPQNTNEQSGCTLKISGERDKPLSRGNPLRFPGRKQTLGPAYLGKVKVLGWQVEITGTTPDDISNYDIYQTWEEVTTTTMRLGDNVVTSTGEPQRGDEYLTGRKYGYTYQPKGGHRFFSLDAPGFTPPLSPDVLSAHMVRNFTTYLKKGEEVCKQIEWSVEETYSGSSMPMANFFPNHRPFP